MPGGRAYDYSAPFFGGFTCAPPTMNTTRSDRADAFASSRADSLRRSTDFASSRQSSFARSDSIKSNPRQDSLTRPPLTRQSTLSKTTTTSTTEYSIGGGSSTPRHVSTTTYTSPYSNYRTTSRY